jgi:hypothetical protein
LSLSAIASEVVDLGGSQERRIDLHMLPIVESDMGERNL